MREGELLWEPRGGSKLAEFMRERGLRGLPRALALVGRGPGGLLGHALGPLRGRRQRDGVLASEAMPGAEWFPGTRLNYAEYLLGQARAGETAVVHATESRALAELSWDELRDQVARCAAGLRRLGVGKGDRVAAYMPNTPETLVAFLACASIGAIWSSCAPEFGTPTVVDRFRQIEPKLLLAIEGYRYGGKDFDRRAARRRDRGGDPVARAHRDGPERLGRAARGARGARVRAGGLRPPALGALLVRHHRPAEGDRAGPRRHPARAPEEGASAHRPVAGRPLLLVHHHRLDDVELPGRRDALGRRDRALGRRARRARDVGLRPRGRGHDLRHQRRLHHGLHEGGSRARSAADRARDRLHGVAAAGGRLRVGLPALSGRLALLDERRNRPLHGVRGRGARAARLRGRDPGPLPGRGRGVLERRRAAARRRGRRARDHPADALDAGRVLERPGRRALPRRATSRRSPACGDTATGSRSPSAARP